MASYLVSEAVDTSVCLVGGVGAWCPSDKGMVTNYWGAAKNTSVIIPKTGTLSGVDDRVSELVAQLYNQSTVVYTHRPRGSGCVSKRLSSSVLAARTQRNRTGTHLDQVPIRFVGHSAGCVTIARMVSLIAVHRAWWLKNIGTDDESDEADENRTQSELAILLRLIETIPPDIMPRAGPVFIGDDGDALDIRLGHIRSVGYVCAPCDGLFYLPSLGYYPSTQSMAPWSLCWCVWALVYVYERLSRVLPILRKFNDVYMEQVESFSEGVTTGLALRELDPCVARSIFFTATEILNTCMIPHRRVVSTATTTISRYHIILYRKLTTSMYSFVSQVILVPSFFLFGLCTRLCMVPNDGLVPVSSQRAGVQCPACVKCPNVYDCAACGTIYDDVEHMNVLDATKITLQKLLID
jgi:hypothetical protein